MGCHNGPRPTGNLPYVPANLWTPAEITTALWLDAADAGTITDAGGGAVSAFNDKSGNARHFTQATAGLRPTTGVETLDGKNVLQFAGDCLTNTSSSEWTFLHDGTEYTIFSVVKFGAVANPNVAYGLFGNSRFSTNTVRGITLVWDDRSGVSRNEQIIFFAGNGNGGSETDREPLALYSGNGYIPPNDFVVFEAFSDMDNGTAADRGQLDFNAQNVIANNTRTATPSASAPTNSDVQLGALGNNGFPLTGAIAEHLIVPGPITTDLRQILQGYLAWKWGLQANLPSGHPYELAAPTLNSDPYFANVSLLLHMDGADASTTFTDSSGAGTTVSVFGNSQLDTSQFKFGTASGLFDGSGDYLFVPAATFHPSGSLTDIVDPFTIEGFVRPNSLASAGTIFSNRKLISTIDNGFSLRLNTNGTLRLFALRGVGVTVLDSTSATTLSTGTWYHVALVFDGAGNWEVYLNGVSIISVTQSNAVRNDSGTFLTFAANASPANYLNGWLDDLRITKGVARYTAAFTPPTAPFPNA